MAFSLSNFVDRWSRTAIIASVTYSCVCALVMLTGVGGAKSAGIISAWGAFPLICTLTLLLWPVINDPLLSRERRLAFRLFFVAEVLDVVASLSWGYIALTHDITYGTWPDVLWMLYYPLTTVAAGLLYYDLGGRLNTTRSIVDFATVAIGIGALLWFTALAPLATMDAAQLAQNWSAASFGIGNGVVLIAGAMVAMQVTDWRAQHAILWWLIAMPVSLTADLFWVNAELSKAYELGKPMDLIYHVFYICLLMCARAQRKQQPAAVNTQGLPGVLRGSLPIVALMVGVVALLTQQLHLADFQSPLLIFVVLCATVLVMVGQALSTRELVTLQRELTTRRFDERLTELVRRSSDMIAICDNDGVIRYASPSAEQLLGMPAGEIDGHRLDDVLGPEAGHVRAAFDEVLRNANSEQVVSFEIPLSGEEKRSFKMVIANLCHVESIRGVTLNIRDVSDATRLHDQLRTLAFHDSLTLLANRALFADRVHQAVRHIPDGMQPAVLFIDLDNFKTVNDSLGHSAGDQLLRSFAHRLVQCTRAGDTVARLGGDEFAVLIDHAPNIEAAQAVANQIIEACRQPMEIEGRSLRIGASIGIAISDRVSNVERLLRNADAAMYAAKARCKGNVEVFQPEMLRAARRRIRIENELVEALEKNELEAHYQPIVDLSSRHLVGVEALMRWRHPARGMVMPGAFIPLAEETGQIIPMTQWMLDRACRDAARLQRELEHGAGLRMSVNVSSRYLNQGDVVAEVRAALEKHGVAPECLILEVTESLLLENSSRLAATFKALKLTGVKLALDDFGTGYSSLAYLHRFPIDILKIDRSFVQRLDRDSEGDGTEGVDAVALARAILSLADALGLDTVAEGIELDTQRNTLLALGCKTGQGYAFGKPMPVEEILDAAVTRRRGVLAGNLAGRIDFSATGRFRAMAE